MVTNMKSVKCIIENNKYSAVCPYDSEKNTVTHIPQKLFVLQLNHVCKHYKNLNMQTQEIVFGE